MYNTLQILRFLYSNQQRRHGRDGPFKTLCAACDVFICTPCTNIVFCNSPPIFNCTRKACKVLVCVETTDDDSGDDGGGGWSGSSGNSSSGTSAANIVGTVLTPSHHIVRYLPVF